LLACYKVTLGQSVFRSRIFFYHCWNIKLHVLLTCAWQRSWPNSFHSPGSCHSTVLLLLFI
jgi:hypothetical protein